MILTNPYIWANLRGIPRLEATGVTVGTDNITYTFKPHEFLNNPFAGLIIFKLPAYTPPTTAVPIVFNTNGKTQNLTTIGNVNVTSADLNQSGVYLAFYDGTTLQILSNI